VSELLAWLAERGWTDVEEITTANETQTFALPRDLPRTTTRRRG
jgi:4-hydroxy-3-methylbut-2-enyl diphosphate reductase